MDQDEDNYLQNRLAESLQISGGAGDIENHLLHNLADPAAGGQELLLEAFDNKENNESAESLVSHSQLNPNAVEFVPSFRLPSSPMPNNAGEKPSLDDLIAESPRKESARDNMDAIVVPDEAEFFIGANSRPHELGQESYIFGDGNLEQQLLIGAGNEPEARVDLDADDDVMKHNASIEDILNSVQPLPEEIDAE